MKNSFKKYYTKLYTCKSTIDVSEISGIIKMALENGELTINEYEVLESQLKTLPFRKGETMDYILAEQKLTVSENFLLSLLDAITRVKKQIDKTTFKDDEREMAFIVRKSIRELECKITTAFHWWYLPGFDPISEVGKEDDPFFDTKPKRVCYLNNEMLRWATELYTDDSRCKGDAFFESKFFKQNIKPELAYIYVSLKNAKVNECGFVVPR